MEGEEFAIAATTQDFLDNFYMRDSHGIVVSFKFLGISPAWHFVSYDMVCYRVSKTGKYKEFSSAIFLYTYKTILFCLKI